MRAESRTIFLLLSGLFFLTQLFGQVSHSKLADGDIYKLSTKKDGVYKLDYAFLEKLGINPTVIDPRKIQILGHGGGTLPEPNSDERIDDLAELAIVVDGEEDGVFDRTDYILFYGESSDVWTFDEINDFYHREENPYDDSNYYFLKIGPSEGKRIRQGTDAGTASYTTESYTARQHHQSDQLNLLHHANDANLQGSGRLWVGEQFKIERIKDFSTSFDFSSAILSEPVYVNMQFLGRSEITSMVNLQVDNVTKEARISSTDVFDIERDYAKFGIIKHDSFYLTSNDPEVKVNYPSQGNNNVGWLDYLEFNFRAKIEYKNDPLIFSDLSAPSGVSCQYQISTSNSSLLVWDITDKVNPLNLPTSLNGSVLTFNVVQQPQSTFLTFDPARTNTAEAIGKIENQDLHGIGPVDYVIVYHSNFKEAADKLANHRRNFNQFNLASVSVDEVMHEFSSGKTDPTAIRDFARMLHKKYSDFRFLVLMGDGSFDYRHLYQDLPDESFIPVYETERSLHPIESFPSDDYYALLDDQEGGSWRGALDIAVGRIPVRTLDEANIVVNKIIDYETDQEYLGDWRVNVLFVADDEDSNRHLNSADDIAENTKDHYPVFNINKVYLDAYEQENTPGGVFNFKAKEALNQNLFKGQLVVNYIGHGGAGGWAQERVLQKEDIDKWNNLDRLPLLITATCSFAGYDDPRRITAGEYTITHPSGGSIALYSTVRAVYANQNERLTRSVFDHLFEPVNGEMLTIGEILVNSKNSNPADTAGTNARKFTLLGDPALRLAIPSYSARTLKINGKSVEEANLDTLKALSRVEIEGEIIDPSGNPVSGFNGKIYPTIFDKAVALKTLAQDKGSTERTFNLQKSVIFKGLASVTNGRFKFTFVVPKDINYAFGNGKISYYAEDGSNLDAGGAFDEVTVGGTNQGGLNDTKGPDIELFMNDENFVYGGITDRNPVLLIKLSDENGINVIGNSIGHDLTAVLDQNLQGTILLNDFYESSQDDYTSGMVTYPLSNLEPGSHQLEIKAWDVANNSSEALIEFIVVDEAEDGLRHVLNYPNPFSHNTCFQFEHQLQDLDLDIKVEILTPSGRIVNVLEQSVKASGFLSRDVKWDGTDEFGDPLGNGIYIYRITVTTEDARGRLLKNTSDLQKLVILR
ncbi:MAG: type IX secretion system sortase PorU [Saprospiraceae bacterium]|nr:type IX secretion system sortase PorU [Saprospiraceae bacterium]